MKLTYAEHSTIHCALGLYMSSIDATLKEGILQDPDEVELLKSIKEEVLALSKRFGRRYGE